MESCLNSLLYELVKTKEVKEGVKEGGVKGWGDEGRVHAYKSQLQRHFQ